VNYNATLGIIAMKKHVLNEHAIDLEHYKILSKASEASG
jgi:hypothetical protein